MAKKLKNNSKILVVCQHYWPETFRINEICDFLTDKGHDVDVLCGLPNYPSGKLQHGYKLFGNRREKHNKVNVERVFEVPRGNNSNFRIFVNYVSFPIASLFHVPRLLTRKYDKIILYQLSPVMMSIAGIIVAKIKRVETTMYVLDLWPENLFSVLNPKSSFAKRFITWLSHWHYRRIDKFIVLSNKMKESIIRVTGLPDDKVIVLPQACEKLYEEDKSDPVLEKRFKSTFNILFAGNISPAQSFETIIGAAKILKSKNLKDVRWIIVGDGMSRKWLEEEVGKAELSDYFYFEGQKPVADIPYYNSVASVLVGCLVKSNMLEATIPAKVMSYIASGKPMAIAMDGEVQTLINKTIGCGFATPTEDYKTLAKSIETIYKMTPAERKSMGLKGRKYHHKNLEINIILSKLYSFLIDS